MLTTLVHLWTHFKITAVENLPETLAWKEESVAVPVNLPSSSLDQRTAFDGFVGVRLADKSEAVLVHHGYIPRKQYIPLS